MDFEGLWIRKCLRSEGGGFLLTGTFTQTSNPPTPGVPETLMLKLGMEMDPIFHTQGLVTNALAVLFNQMSEAAPRQ